MWFQTNLSIPPQVGGLITKSYKQVYFVGNECSIVEQVILER